MNWEIHAAISMTDEKEKNDLVLDEVIEMEEKKFEQNVYYHNAVDLIDMLMSQACKCDASVLMYDALKLARMIANEKLSEGFDVNDGR